MSMIIPMIISTSSAGRQVTWPEGLPVNPLLPLTLVSRTFRRCAQARLFNNVRLKDQCEAYLFLQALTCTSTEESVVRSTPIDSRAEHDTTQGGELESLQSSDNSHSNLHRLTRLVRSIQFAWNGPSSMGMGGGSLICDIVRSCPLLKDIAIRIPFLDHCEEPLLEALKSRPLSRRYSSTPTSPDAMLYSPKKQSLGYSTVVTPSKRSISRESVAGQSNWITHL
ncbi:hypothetical protein KEM48_007472 [Puccinia striiformis f. sp. tritici PST-130]|nr:hypothetical protein KEM48_007472 [Puccinia striiformis f. sp. tritici PST-130]